MKKLYGELHMSWLNTILFAVVTGVYTGIVMLFPFLQGTSFQDIGITVEMWVIFAVIVVVNCRKAWEAMLKCFVFFLISQPLVYLVQIAVGALEFSQGLGYYLNIWLPATMLTLPGGLIAYFCKKQTPIGAFILGLGNSIQAAMAVVYFVFAFQNFPHHLLSAIVSLGSIFVMTYYIQKKKTNRLISLLTPIAMVILMLVFLKLTGRVLF